MLKRDMFFVPYLFCVFFPYINPIVPLHISETAPYAGIYSVILLLAYYVPQKNIYIKIPHFYIMLWLGVFICYYQIDRIFDFIYIKQVIKMLCVYIFGSAVFCVAYLYAHKIMEHYKILINFIIVWIVVGILQLSPLKTIIENILPLIMARSVSFSEGLRGIAILANEPSYAGIHLVFFMIIIDILFSAKKISKIQNNILYILLILMIICTKAGTSLLLFFIYLATKILFIYTWKKRFAIFILSIIMFIIIYQNIDKFSSISRAFSLLKIVLKNPELLLTDGSILVRYMYIIISYYGLISTYGFGNGLASYSFTWKLSPLITPDFRELNEIKLQLSRDAIMPASFLGGLAYDFGVLGLFISLYVILRPLFSAVSISDKKYIYLIISNILLLWIQACSYALPIPWFLLGIAYGLANNKITLSNTFTEKGNMKIVYDDIYSFSKKKIGIFRGGV